MDNILFHMFAIAFAGFALGFSLRHVLQSRLDSEKEINNVLDEIIFSLRKEKA